MRALDAVGADHGLRRLGVSPPVEMRLQQLPHQLAPLLLQEAFEVAVGHARSLLGLEPIDQDRQRGFGLCEPVGGGRCSRRRQSHRGPFPGPLVRC